MFYCSLFFEGNACMTLGGIINLQSLLLHAEVIQRWHPFWCFCELGHSLGLGDMINEMLVLGSSVKSIISMMSCDCDTVEMQGASLVVNVGSDITKDEQI